MSKLVSLEALTGKIHALKQAGLRLVFTNGGFDLLHVGHVRYLTAARLQGDVLIIGLNSDSSVRRIKGEKRPIIPQAQRAEVLSALNCVDHVVLFDEADPLHLIQVLQPDVLVKGADWAERDIIGADVVRRNGGRVVRVKLAPDVSTSRIINRIVDRYGHS
jgi:D-beta-D-heptose 7-phosphate kinase/D-beta-D-heptose 1-phosphate adenosyltransferase